MNENPNNNADHPEADWNGTLTEKASLYLSDHGDYLGDHGL